MIKFSNIKQYYRDVVAEIGKVTWPDRNRVITVSIMVCIVILIASICCVLVDFAANRLVSFILKLSLF